MLVILTIKNRLHLICFSWTENLATPRDISIDDLLKNTFPLPSEDEFEELEENDRKRTGIQSDLTMAQGRRFNDGRQGQLNINRDILPYDQTRVKLRSPINKIDYINASWIQTSHEEVYDDLYEFLASSKINFICHTQRIKKLGLHANPLSC